MANLKRKKSATKAPARKAVKVDDLTWNKVNVPDGLDSYEGFFGLEEISGVNIVKDGNRITFQAKDEEPEPEPEPAKQVQDGTYISPFGEEDYDNLESESDSESEEEEEEEDKNDMDRKMLSNVGFAALENEEDDYPDKWGLGLSIPVRKALDKLGFNAPTEIQKEAIPEMVANNHVIGKAATGSGKTLAYGLPIIQKHLQLEGEESKKWPTGVIFAPTRELVHQIADHLKSVAEHCAFDGSGVVPITGGLSIQKQVRLLSKNPAIVVATPGRFLELLQSSNDVSGMFKRTETLVLDEADRLIQDGHFEEMEKVLDILGRGKRQTCVFSATFDREFMNKLSKRKKQSKNESIVSLLKAKLEFNREPVFVDANPAEAVASDVTQALIECGAMEKDLFTYYFCLTYQARTIVFVNSIYAVKRITPLLKNLNIQAFALHSEMIQRQRLRSLERFKEQTQGVLIATDVAARGLDIPLVDHVVHYHVPRTADMYVHRSGRTARAGATGYSVVLCCPDEAAPLQKLQRMMKRKMGHLDVDFDMTMALKERVRLAKEITDGTAKTTKANNNDWLKQAAEDLGADLSELDDKTTEKDEENKHELRVKRAQLKQLLAKPVGSRSSHITSGVQNMAHLMMSGKMHENFMTQKSKLSLRKK